MKKVFPCSCLVLWLFGGYAGRVQAQPVFSLRVVKILNSSFLEKPCPSCGPGGASEIPLGEATPGDSFVIEAFASNWDREPDIGLCQSGQACRVSDPECPDSHCTDANNPCLSKAQCNAGALCVVDTCKPNPLVGAFQFTMNAETFTNGFPGGFDVPQLPCDDLACDDDPFFEGCSCFHGIEFAHLGLCTCFNPSGSTCVPGVCSGGPNEGGPCTSAADCMVCVGGENDGVPCDRDAVCFGGGLCEVSGETCEGFFRCWLGASAFIDLSRPDYILQGFASIDAVDAFSSANFAWIGALQQGGIVPEKLGCGGDPDSPCTINAGCRVCVGGLNGGGVCAQDTDCRVCLGGDDEGEVCTANTDCAGNGTCPPGGVCPPAAETCDRIPSYMGTLILQSARNSRGTYSINFVDDDDFTFLNDDGLARLPAPILEPAVINFPDVDPTLTAVAPYDRLKNRVISIDPNSANPIVMKVELLDRACNASGAKCTTEADCDAGETCDDQSEPVMLGFVSDPITLGAASQLPEGSTVARVVKDMPAPRVWSETVVHVSDCEIAPVQSYAISASTDGLLFSGPLRIGTIKQPAGKAWGDYVGSAAGGVFTPPNGLLNVDDLSALLFFFQGRTVSDREYVVTTLELVGGDNPEIPSFVISASDLQAWLGAFGGGLFPPPSFPNQGGPADCP